MNDWVTSLIVIVLSGVVIGGILIIYYRRQTRQAAQLAQEAQSRGWQYQRIQERLVSGFRLSGAAGGDIAWTLESTRRSSDPEAAPGSSNVALRTRWWSEAVTLPDRWVLIGPRAPGASAPGALGGLGGVIVQAALKMMIGEDAGRIAGLKEALLGSETLRQRYMIFAHDPDEARALLSSGVESALIGWPERQQVIVKLGRGGLEISLPGQQVADASQVERIVGLGARLVANWRSRA